jgi:GntR family transcriptional regulator of vanillate catabolism
MHENGRSQTLKAVVGLRGMILNGELKPGTRVSELLLVERLQVSRTPAAKALVQLRHDGLLESLPSGGFVVATFSSLDIVDGIELRGTLEGLAARLAAERGAPPTILAQMQDCVEGLGSFLRSFQPDSSASDEYARWNDQFHNLLVQSCQSTIIQRSLQRLLSLPFLEPNATVSRPLVSSRVSDPDHFLMANEQHRSIIEAIQNREGTRAAALTLEHARSAWKVLRSAGLESLYTYCRP